VDGVLAHVRPQEADVVGDRTREQARVLPDPRGALVPVGRQDVGERDGVDEHRAVVRAEQAEQERGERRLARPRTPDDPDPLAAGDDEADRRKGGFVGARVREADVAHLDPFRARAGLGSGGQQRAPRM